MWQAERSFCQSQCYGHIHSKWADNPECHTHIIFSSATCVSHFFLPSIPIDSSDDMIMGNQQKTLDYTASLWLGWFCLGREGG